MRQLVIMAKVPRAGRVKTRLAAGLGTVEALRFYRNALAATVRRLVQPGRWQTRLSIAPDTASQIDFPFVSNSGLKLQVQPQGPGDLGARLQRVFQMAPPGAVLVIGSDIPAITPTLISDAFAVLEGQQAVFGPSDDGGFWLIGLQAGRRFPPHLFKGVRWSTSHARADSVQALGVSRVGMVASLDDVDDIGSFNRLHALSTRVILPVSS
ncbi:MAG: TIGR04282 family arsenosugar biosynthesis glycosyltransferase [Pseudomonadota bacterium]